MHAAFFVLLAAPAPPAAPERAGHVMLRGEIVDDATGDPIAARLSIERLDGPPGARRWRLAESAGRAPGRGEPAAPRLLG